MHSEELYDLNSTPNIIHVFISGLMTWLGLVACMGRKEVPGSSWFERDHLENRCKWRYNIKMDVKEIEW
jgi:hypothetical protein